MQITVLYCYREVCSTFVICATLGYSHGIDVVTLFPHSHSDENTHLPED